MHAFVCTTPKTAGQWQEEAKPTVTEGQVLVQLAASGINYKDALAALGKAPILRSLPLTPGIDGAGTIIEGGTAALPNGTSVVLTGHGSGEDWNGSWAEYQLTEPGNLVRLPEAWTARAAMAIGTAGFTAALGLNRLQLVLGPRLQAHPDKPVLVTGATGGVGLWALRLCAAHGIPTVAVSGKSSQTVKQLLHAAGADKIITREALIEAGKKPLGKERYSAAIDAVGGDVLASILPQIGREGAVATAGVAAGGNLPTTVYPFILRGISLLGLASAYCSPAMRQQAWQTITTSLQPETVSDQCTTMVTSKAVSWCEQMLAGATTGRGVIVW